MRTVYQLQLTRAVDMKKVVGYNREVYAVFIEMLERGVRQGEFKTALPPDALIRHFVMAICYMC